MPPSIHQMQVSMLKAGGGHEFLARSHLFLSSTAGLYRNKYWAETMDADILVYDFQDGCSEGQRENVFIGLDKGHLVFPNKPFSVRLTELERNDEVDGPGNNAIKREIKACIEQKQVRWLMLPMCDNKDDVQAYIDIINSIDEHWLKNHGALQMIVETPIGLYNLDNILECHREVQGLIVGAGDYFRFVQGSKETCLPMLRWDILNACLRHQRFPIDAPTFHIQLTENLPKYVQGVKDAGYKSMAILHPAQSKLTNELLTETDAAKKEHHLKANEWYAGRQTGYTRGSGDDFVDPPHAKLSTWLAHYSTNTSTKRTFLLNEIDPKDLKRTKAFLKDLASELDEADPTSYGIKHTSDGKRIYDKWMTVVFLAIVTTNHSRHKDILCNLGFTNAIYHSMNDGTFTEMDAKYVMSTLVSRRVTLKGERVIAGYDCEILDENYNTMFSVRMFLMEKIIPYETFVEKVDYSASSAEIAKRVEIDEAKKLAKDSSKKKQEKEEIFKSPGLKLHSDYCDYLKLDAPLHHTVSPTVPSTLHLTCHRLPWHGVTKVCDVCYHAPMKPDHKYIRSVTKIGNSNNTGITTHLSLVKDKSNGQLMSSVMYEYDAAIADKEALLNEDVEEESTDEVFSDNPKEIENQNTYVTRFFCCLVKKNNVEESKSNQKKLSRGRTLNNDTTTSPSLVGLSGEYDC